jgi:hypothetical protein
MLQTYEAVLQPNGSIRFLEPSPPSAAAPCHVLVTFVETASHSTAPAQDWKHLAGTLKGSPNLNGDPLAIQQEMRHEWD